MLVNNTILKNINKKKNILYSHTDNKTFIKMLNNIYGASHVATIDESIFGHKNIDLIICNNRLDSLETCIALSYYYHSPLLIVDHKPKPDSLNISQVTQPQITCYQISINEGIAQSWGCNACNEMLEISIDNQDNIKKWETSINNILAQIFKVKTTS
jgi:hypothetical protein